MTMHLLASQHVTDVTPAEVVIVAVHMPDTYVQMFPIVLGTNG